METFYDNVDKRKAMQVYNEMYVFPLMDSNEILVIEKKKHVVYFDSLMQQGWKFLCQV